jgi:hypothetical protein
MGKLEKHILDISLYYNQIQWFRFTSEETEKVQNDNDLQNIHIKQKIEKHEPH